MIEFGWPECFEESEVIFLEELYAGGATEVIRLWGAMDIKQPQNWPAIFWKDNVHNCLLPSGVLPHLYPGRHLDLSLRRYINE